MSSPYYFRKALSHANEGCLLTQPSSSSLDVKLSCTCPQRANELEWQVPAGCPDCTQATCSASPLEPAFPIEVFAIFLPWWNISNVFQSKKRDVSLAQDPDIGFKGISYGPHQAGTLTSGPFLLVLLLSPKNGISVWSSDQQLQHGEASLQGMEPEEKTLKPHGTFLGLHPDRPLGKAGLQAAYLLGTGVTGGLSFWCRVPPFGPCCVHTYDPQLTPGPQVTMRAMENKVATQLFGLFPNGHDPWQLKRASRDRTCGGAEEGGEESVM